MTSCSCVFLPRPAAQSQHPLFAVEGGGGEGGWSGDGGGEQAVYNFPVCE